MECSHVSLVVTGIIFVNIVATVYRSYIMHNDWNDYSCNDDKLYIAHHCQKTNFIFIVV